jgi:hypothetical protein
VSGETQSTAVGGPAPAGWGITAAQLPPRIQRRMIDADHDDRQAERDEKAARERRHEEAADRVVALGIAAAHARGEYPAPMELAAMRLPADDKERDARTRDAIDHVLAFQRAQYQRELAWEKDHPSPPAGPPEKLHVFFDEPRLPAPAARSATGRRIAARARRFGAVLEARKALAAAERAAAASKHDIGLVEGVVVRSREDDDDRVVAAPASRRGARPARRDDGIRFR